MVYLPYTTLAFAAAVSAWLPGKDHTIYNKDGVNIFAKNHAHARRSDISAPVYGSGSTQSSSNTAGSSLKVPTSGDWLPPQASNHKIRGVNTGSLFVFEPWIAQQQWNDIGCGDAQSEFDCGIKLGKDGVTAAMKKHWEEWYTEDDITQMTQLGLNTIRIPLGYWMYEDIVDSSEPFPQGGFPYLQKVCGWASDAGMFIILDLHGAPGAQVSNNSDTGQYASTPGFYSTYNYQRATKFLQWITTKIHTINEFRNVGMLEIVNEPIQGDSDDDDSMTSNFYPQAYQKIRETESNLTSSANPKPLHVEMMNELWGAGTPTSSLPSDATNISFDDHRYIKWASGQTQTKDAYMQTSCNDDRGSDNENPTIVGEFSLSAPNDDTQQWDSTWNPHSNVDWYLGWFSAQAKSYEKSTDGWIFWAWKMQLGDPRWEYNSAVKLGIIPKNLDAVYNNTACNGY